MAARTTRRKGGAGAGSRVDGGGADADAGDSDSSSVFSIDEDDFGEAGARRRTEGRGVPGTKPEPVDVVHWRPPYPSRPWRSRPETILVQAGASAASRKRAALGNAELLRELVVQYGRQSPHVGISPVVAEEICYHISEDALNRQIFLDAGALEITAKIIKEHLEFPKIQMGAMAVLACLTVAQSAKEEAFNLGLVDDVYLSLVTHWDHNGARSWTCGALSNLCLLTEANLRFQALNGVELLVSILKEIGSLPDEEVFDPFDDTANIASELIGTCGRALRACLEHPDAVKRSVQRDVVPTLWMILHLRGQNPPVREGMFACIKEISSYPEFRHLSNDLPDLKAGYTLIRTVVKFCTKKVRTPPPTRVEGVQIIDSPGIVQAFNSLAYLVHDPVFCREFSDSGGFEVLVESLRDVAKDTENFVQFSGVCAILNATMTEHARVTLEEHGAVAVVTAIGAKTLHNYNRGALDPRWAARTLTVVGDALSGLALAPRAVSGLMESELYAMLEAPSTVEALPRDGTVSMVPSMSTVFTTYSHASAREGAGASAPRASSGALPAGSRTHGARAGSGGSFDRPAGAGKPLSKDAARSKGGRHGRSPPLGQKTASALRHSASVSGDVVDGLLLPPGRAKRRGCPITDVSVPLAMEIITYCQRCPDPDFLEPLRAAIQVVANLAVMPVTQVTLVESGAVDLVCSLLDTHWENVPVMVAVCCMIANVARNDKPSLRPLLYSHTEDSTRLVRLIYTHIEVSTLMEHAFGALANLWIPDSPAEQGVIMDAMVLSSPLQALHTILRHNATNLIVQAAAYRAIRNLAAVGPPDWADTIGKVFIGPLVSLLKLYPDDQPFQESGAACLGVMSRGTTNRDEVIKRDGLEAIVAHARLHIKAPGPVFSFVSAVAQLALSASKHSPLFTRDVLKMILEVDKQYRKTHPGIHHWVLTTLHNISNQHDELIEWVTRQPEGMALVLEVRETKLKRLFTEDGGGYLPYKWCLEVLPTRIPSR